MPVDAGRTPELIRLKGVVTGTRGGLSGCGASIQKKILTTIPLPLRPQGVTSSPWAFFTKVAPFSMLHLVEEF